MMRAGLLVMALGLVVGGGCSKPSEPEEAAPASTLSLMPPGPKKPTGTVAERIVLAKKQASDKDLTKAVDTLEEAMGIDHKDRESLGLLARYSMERAKEVESQPGTEYYRRLVSSAEYFRRLQATYPNLTDEEKKLGLEVFYAEATGHAKSLRIEETTGSLGDLTGAGFKDFDRIRNDPGWKKILEIPAFRKTFDAAAGKPKTP